MGRTIAKILVADFETATTQTEYFKKHNDTCIYLWNIQDLENDETDFMGTTIASFFKYLVDTNESAIIYFHNLSFDGNFIYKYLMSLGLQWFNDLPRMKAGFSLFRSGNTIYNIKVNLWGGRKLLRFNFKCSLRLLSESIASLGKCYGIQKHKDDDAEDFYDIEPCENVQDYPPRMLEYIHNDVLIMKLALKDFRVNLQLILDWYNLGYKYKKSITINSILTIGAIGYKLITYQAEKFGYEKYRYIDPNRAWEIKRGLRPSKETYDIGQKLFYGGWTDFNHSIQDKQVDCDDGRSYDINSAHPNSMTQLLPYGEALEIPPIDTQFLEYYHITVKKATALSNSCWPLLNWNKRNKKIDKNDVFYQHRYVPELHNFDCWYLKQEWEELQNWYTFEGVKITKTFYFKADYFLKDLIEKEYEFKTSYKQNGQLAVSHAYKILLNSSFGKFGTRALFSNEFYFNDKTFFDLAVKEGFLTKKLKTKSTTFKITNSKIEAAGYYSITAVPTAPTKYFHKVIASTITAYTRIKIWQSIRAVGPENWLYSDTDSCYYKNGNYDKIKVDKWELGAWDLEQNFAKFLVRRSKLYFAIDKDGNVIKDKFAGVNIKWFKKNISLVMGQDWGSVLENANIVIRQTPSGVVLVEKNYKINRTV